MFPELQLQNLDQTLCSKSEQKFSFMTKPQLLNLQQTLANMILIINIGNSNDLHKLHNMFQPKKAFHSFQWLLRHNQAVVIIFHKRHKLS